MVNFFGKIKLSAFLVVFATLSGALRKRADDDLDLNLRLGPPGPPRPASASHVSPVLNTKATHLRQTQSSTIQAQSRVQGQIFPPGMSNNKGSFIRSQEDSQGTFALPRHGIETGRLPPDAYYGRTLPPAQLRESPPSTTWRMFDSQENGIGQGGAKYVPGLLDTSMPQTGNVHPNTGQGSTASSRARRLDSEPKQASLSDASRQWERYSSTYLGRSLPSVTHQGAFFPWAAEKFQERIDLLNLIKESLLKRNSHVLNQGEEVTLRKPFSDWKVEIDIARGYQIKASERVLRIEDQDRKLLKDVESILRKIGPAMA